MSKKKIVVKENKSWFYAKIGCALFLLSDILGIWALSIQGLIFTQLFWNIIANGLLFGYLFFEKNNMTLKFIFSKKKGNILFKS